MSHLICLSLVWKWPIIFMLSSDYFGYNISKTHKIGQKSTEDVIQKIIRCLQSYHYFLVRTIITQPPSNTSVIKGSSAALQCGVSKDPNVEVSWHWFLTQSDPPSTMEVTNSARHTVSSIDGTLTITGVYNVDIGWYRCQVISKGGNDSRSAFFQVTGKCHYSI